MIGSAPIILRHNFDSSQFMWLYAKYATGGNPTKHCTNAIIGKYSKKFSKHNEKFTPGSVVIMDEFMDVGWDSIYICGVSKKGYASKKNYPHNAKFSICSTTPIPGLTSL